MRRVIIKSAELFWDEWTTEHIKKHGVTRIEIEESLLQGVQAGRSYKGRVLVFGVTRSKRLLALAMKKTNRGYYIFSARDASRKERKHI